MNGFTPEFFVLYGNGPDAEDSDIDMMPVLIGGPTYTSSYFGGSRFNDSMFDSYDSTYATSIWALGFKLKYITTGPKLTHEFQIMKNFVFATELGYIPLDEDSNYDDAISGEVKVFWKVACAVELSLYIRNARVDPF